MNIQSIILLAAVLALAVWVLRLHLRKRKEGGCCGSCHGCQGCPPGHDCCSRSRQRTKQK